MPQSQLGNINLPENPPSGSGALKEFELNATSRLDHMICLRHITNSRHSETSSSRLSEPSNHNPLTHRGCDVRLVFHFPGYDSFPADHSTFEPTSLETVADADFVFVEKEVSGCGTEFDACHLQDGNAKVRREKCTISMPAHKVVLALRSDYFDTFPNLDLKTTSVITEHASSAEEVRAMEAVLEYMYTGRLPFYCTSSWTSEWDKQDVFGEPSHTLRLLLTLQVADRWRVDPSLAECCTSIYVHLAKRIANGDYSVYDLPAGVKEPFEETLGLSLSVAAVTHGTVTAPPSKPRRACWSNDHSVPN